jgi:hypothetical protein
MRSKYQFFVQPGFPQVSADLDHFLFVPGAMIKARLVATVDLPSDTPGLVTWFDL